MRKVFVVVLISCVVFVLGFAGHRGYVTWRQGHLVKQARKFLANSDARNALLCLQRVVRSNPRDVEACRLMAGLAEALRSPNALFWRSNIVNLNPDSLDDRLALARTALTAGDLATATNALQGASASDKNTATFHKAAGAVATAANRLTEAESHFLEASRLEPENPVSQLNVAVLRLQKNDPKTVAEARTTLEHLRTNPAVRCDALRELALNALRNQQAEEALALSLELVQQTNSSFGDRLLRLNVLRQTKNPQLSAALATFQNEATNHPVQIYELVKWQLATGSPKDALAWLQSLPMGTQTNQPVPLIAAECYNVLKDWPGLQTALEPQNWADLEFLRHAYRTRALREQALSVASKAEWQKTLKAAEGRSERLSVLLRMAADWNWSAEVEEILWTFVNRFPAEKWAFRALNDTLNAAGKTRSLLTLYSKAAETDPTNYAAKNNLAMTAMLLNAPERKPHELARQVYEHDPKNPFYVSTYAFSLYLQDKAAEALQLFNQLKPEQLENPMISAYYGIILQAAGNDAKARKYLDLAAQAKLLPEEADLVRKAKARI